MITANLFVKVLGLVLLALAAIKLPEPPRLSYGWAGLFLLWLSSLL